LLLLALLTRFEGLILLIPLVLWTLWRWIALRTARGRLVLGAAMCVATVPALALGAALFWIRVPLEDLPLRLDPWTRFQTWFDYVAGHTSAALAGFNPLLPADMEPMSLGSMLWAFVPTMTRGLGPVYALHLWYDRAICPRYALSIVLLASPFAALGLLGLVHRATCLTERLGYAGRTRAAVAGLLIFAVAAVGVGAAMSSNQRYFASRKLAADLGRWVGHGPWSAPMIVGPVGLTPIVSFYAGKGRYEMFRIDSADAVTIGRLVEQCHPDLVILRTTKRMDSESCEGLGTRIKARGFSEVDPVPRPARSDELAVFVRDQAEPRVATRVDR
jgi:hypothetical protein